MDLSNAQAINCKKRGINLVKRHSLKTDMTPLVDLGFLLISFFVIVAELTKPSITPLYMPRDGGVPTPVGESTALTVLLGKNNTVYYYEGDWNKISHDGIKKTDFSMTGLSKVITEKQLKLDMTLKNKGGRDAMMLIIKAGSHAIYKDLVKVLDEAIIHMVKRYALVKSAPEEINYLEKQDH
jgi:biopolymer transport protein ExbD